MPPRPASPLTAAEYASVRAPIDRAMTLPARAFTSDAFFQAEVAKIFSPNWTALCFAHTLPQPGDLRPVTLFGMPLLAVRGDDGQIRVFHNVCPYDGCPAALKAAAGVREIEVYYHGWRYDLRGRLAAAPYWNGWPDCDARAVGKGRGDLVGVRTETRLDVVFVNLDGRATDIDAHLRPLLAETAEYDMARAVPVEDDGGPIAREGRILATNWKTYLENAAINVLHEGFTHESYRRSPEVPRVKDGRKTYTDIARGPLMALAYEMADFARTYESGGMTPHLGKTPGKPPSRGYFITYFPNLVMPFRRNMFRINICLPEGPARTRILHCGYFHRDAPVHPEFSAYHRTLVGRFRTAYAEDGVAVEAVQRARHSPAWSQHYYAPFWDIQHHHLNRLVADDLMKKPGRSAAKRGKKKPRRRR